MSGTKAGGLKAAATNKSKYGENFYAAIGQKGGRNGHTGGFYASPERAKIAGRKGGMISTRKANPQSLAERRREIEELLKQEEELTSYETSF